MTPERRIFIYQILVFIIFSAGIIIAGYLYYSSYEKEFRSGVEEQLTSVGDLKVNELVRWRNERIGDAKLLSENPVFSSLVSRFIENPDNQDFKSDIQTWLSNIQIHFHYSQVFLLSPDGTVLITAPNTSHPISSKILENIPSVIATGQTKFIDFYRDKQDDRIYLTLLIPIFEDDAHNNLLSIVGLQITPDEFLYPFIAQWPTGSESAETLLVRKDDDSVLYLNKLRFREDIALSHRLPLNMTERPAVQAALGNEGIIEGVDYRGAAVIAYIRNIPDSPWFMVARVDTAEVFESLAARANDLIIIVIFLLITTGGGFYVLHQRENDQYYREQMKIKEALSESEALFKGIFNTMPSGAVIYSVHHEGSQGSDYIVSDFNQAGLKIEGISREEIIGKPITTIRPEIDEFGIIPIFQKVYKTGETIYYPAKIYVSSKEARWYENYVFRLPSNQIVAIYNDVTEKMLADEERERLINQLGQNNEQINAAYEQLAGAEEELRYQYNTIASTEEHLRQTTTYLENLITNANVPIIVWSPDYSITRINHSCENLIGKTAKEVIGRPIKVLFPPSQVEYLMRLLQTAEAGVRWDTIEMPVQHTDGTIRSVVWNSSTIYDASGENPVATIAQGQDITVRKRLEHENKLSIAQIQKNLAQLSILNDQIRNPLTLILTYTEMSENCDIADDISEQVKRIDEIVTHLDQRWNESEKILQMLRKNYNIIVSPSVHQVIRDRAARNGQEPDNHSDSSFRSSRLLVQEIEAELFTILDSIDAYIYVADLENYELLYLNKRGRNLFGDITGKTCYQVIEKDQTGPCPFCTNHLLIDTSGPIGVCQSERKNTRNGRWYDCRDRVIRWSDGRLVHLQIATDITDRKAIEDEIRENEYTFRKLYEESSDPILLMQKDQFIECNQAAVDLLKLADKKQLIGSNPVEVSPEYQPDGRRSVEAAQQYIEKAHREGKCRFEWRCTRSDGTSVLLEVSLLPIMFKGEEMLHVTWRDITERKAVEEAIIRSKTELKRKLDAILLPEGDIGTLNLSDIIDVPEIQLLMDDFYSLTKIGVAILDIEGTILVATGWQDICTKFHRVHPETCKNCIESDTQLSTNVAPGTFRLYRCRNNMWDIATPIIVGGVHLGNLFLGQFLFDDEIIDYSLFRKQAREYGFDEEAYIHALEQVPRWSRETVDTVMHFYTKLVHLISDVSWGSIRLARIVTERDALIKAVQTKNEQLKASLEKSNQLTEELHEREEELRKQVDEIEKPIRVI